MQLHLSQLLLSLIGAGLVVAAPAPAPASPQPTPEPALLARRIASDSGAAYSLVARGGQDTGGGTDPLIGFCQRFNAACLNVCMANAAVGSKQQVTYACKADATGANFNFGCKCGGTDQTQRALNLLGGLTTSTKTIGTSTSITKTTTKPVTTTTTYTTSSISETHTLSYSSTQTDSATKTESYSTTTTSLSVVPTTFTSTYVSTVPYTSLTTVTATSVSALGLPIATTVPFTLLEVSFASNPATSSNKVAAVAPAAAAKRATAATQDVFCINYADACSRQCVRVKSTTSKLVCSRTSTTTFSYRLGCLCKNGYTETRHALADLQQSQLVVSTIAQTTSTQTITQSQTQVVTVTGSQTLTFITETTALFTITNTETTKTTSTSISRTTFSPGTTTSTTTYKPVATATLTSTVLNVLAPTGALRVRHALDDSPLGYLTTSSQYRQVSIGTQDKSAADRYMLVADPNSNSGLYSLRSTADLSYSAVCEYNDFNPAVANFGQNISSYCMLSSLQATAPTAGPAAFLPAGQFYNGPIERFIWAPLISLVGGQNTLKLYMSWINADGSKAVTYLFRSAATVLGTGNKPYLTSVFGGTLDPQQLYLAIEP